MPRSRQLRDLGEAGAAVVRAQQAVRLGAGQDQPVLVEARRDGQHLDGRLVERRD